MSGVGSILFDCESAMERQRLGGSVSGWDEWDTLRAMGWTVVEVPGIPDRSCLVTSQRVVLLRAGLTASDRAAAGVSMLDGALGHESRAHQDR